MAVAMIVGMVVVGILVAGIFAFAAFGEFGYSVRLRRNELPAGLKALYERRYR